jgi:hypothetical protein
VCPGVCIAPPTASMPMATGTMRPANRRLFILHSFNPHYSSVSTPERFVAATRLFR